MVSLVLDESLCLFEDYGAVQLCFVNLRNLLSVFYDQCHLLSSFDYFATLDDIFVDQYFIVDDCLKYGHLIVTMSTNYVAYHDCLEVGLTVQNLIDVQLNISYF